MPLVGVADNQAGRGGPQEWLQALPFVTRYWFGAAAGLTLAVNFDIISRYHIPFYWKGIINDFELWRLITCFLYVGPFAFQTLISIVLLVQFSERYEKSGPFNTGAGGGTADYIVSILYICCAERNINHYSPNYSFFFHISLFFNTNLCFHILSILHTHAHSS